MVKKFEPIKVEKFKTRSGVKLYIVARNRQGRIDQRRLLAGTRKQGLFLADFKKLYKKQWSLYENRIRDPRRNVTQVVILRDVKVKPISKKTTVEIKRMSKSERNIYKQSILPLWKRKPLRKEGQRGKAQYVVQGYYNGKLYVGTSKFKGASAPDGYIFPDSSTSRDCKESAWANLMKHISRTQNTYDADEGLRLVEDFGLTRVREGWMFYPVRHKE